MRWLLISDVHSNLEALQAVLDDADRRWGVARVACAGDVVGLGPDPNECVRRLRDRESVCVAGNHDLMVLSRLKLRCTPAGLRAVEWTRAHLDPEARDWLGALPTASPVAGTFVLCHGSLDDPDEYVVSDGAVETLLQGVRARFPRVPLLVQGHTHHAIWASDGRVQPARVGHRGALSLAGPALANPGSVGQSRTREALARYAVLDCEAGSVDYCGVAYDVAACARKIRDAGLETRLYVTSIALWRGRLRRAVRRVRGRLGRQ